MKKSCDKLGLITSPMQTPTEMVGNRRQLLVHVHPWKSWNRKWRKTHRFHHLVGSQQTDRVLLTKHPKTKHGDRKSPQDISVYGWCHPKIRMSSRISPKKSYVPHKNWECPPVFPTKTLKTKQENEFPPVFPTKNLQKKTRE